MARQLQIVAALGLGLFALQSAPAYAQATRTWVSGVGDDVNPCSRTAPCKTFAGAISKTAAAGEINCLDPGGFGGVTITKSIAINCEGIIGGVLVSGTNGIIVNAAATDVVILSGLNIDGLSTGLSGINVLQAATVQVRNSTIREFLNGGISFTPANVAQLFVVDCNIHENAGGATSAGIIVKPAAGGAANVHINNVRLENNAIGILASGVGSSIGVNINMRDSLIAGNASAGVSAISGAGNAFVAIQMTSNQFSGNFGPALLANGAAASGAGSAIMRVGGSQITANASAVSTVGQGSVLSFGDNKVVANGGGETFSGNIAMK